MVYYLLIIFATAIILIYLIGLYGFFKQNYDNFFVSLTMGKSNLDLLKSNRLNQKDYKKIKFILIFSTILLIILYLLMIYTFKSDYDIFKFAILILIYLVIFISNKGIKKNIHRN